MATTMTTDPYEILGVDRHANEDEIRRAYRRLAKKYHPDMNPGDSVAEDMFKKVGQAYGILGDPEKRRQFDQGEIDALGEPARPTWSHRGAGETGHPFGTSRTWSWRTGGKGPSGPGGGPDPFEDIVSDLFGGGRRGAHFGFGGRQGGDADMDSGAGSDGDVRYTLTVDFVEAARGERKRVRMADGKVLDVSIPAGLQDGQTIRLKGGGRPGAGGRRNGDALIEVTIRPDPRFTRKGNDIYGELEVDLRTAVLGGKVTAETVHGPVTVTVPPNSSSGRSLRLRGKGIKGGNHYAVIRIMLPAKADPALEAFMRSWARDEEA